MNLRDLSISDLMMLSHYFEGKAEHAEENAPAFASMANLAGMLHERDLYNTSKITHDIAKRIVKLNTSRCKEIDDELDRRLEELEWQAKDSNDSTLDRDIEHTKKMAQDGLINAKKRYHH